MRIEIKLTDKQALKIAENIADGNFFIAGKGHFDLDIYQYAELIKIAFNENLAVEKLQEYHRKISPLRQSNGSL